MPSRTCRFINNALLTEKNNKTADTNKYIAMDGVTYYLLLNK